VSEPVRVSGGVGDVAARARRWWPIGVVVAVVTAIVGLTLTWETPRVFVSRATVFPPVSVTNALAGQRYINDMQAAINSFTVRNDVAEKLGVDRSALGARVDVRRIRQSSVMEVVLQSPERLADPSQALEDLITRAGQSLAAPDVQAAAAQQELAVDAVAAAEDRAVEAKRAREDFLADHNGVTPASQLAILGPELADLRLCAVGAIVPPGSDPAVCQDQVEALETTAATLAEEEDQLAALDRDLAQAESDVAEAKRDQREADAVAVRAEAGPAVEVSRAGDEVSQLPSLFRRSIAIIGGALLLGFAVVVALALLIQADRRPRPGPAPEMPDRSRRSSS
jgi:hypothetical protein